MKISYLILTSATIILTIITGLSNDNSKIRKSSGEPDNPLFLAGNYIGEAETKDYLTSPLEGDNKEAKPLNSCYNSSLQSFLELEINKNPQWKKLIDNRKMSVGIVDLSDITNPRFANINGNHMMYAASLPKIAVLLAVTDALEKKEIKETEEVKKDMRLMISKSNNQATTRLIDLVGYKKIESVVRDPKYKLYEETEGGGLWVGKRYAAGGATNREPLKNLSHAATANQVCRFYYMLFNKKLVSAERSNQMLDIMKDPELHHKFVNTLEKIAPGAKLFRKSGSWKSWHSDSVLVLGKKRKYILVALIEDSKGEQIIRDLVVPVEKAINNKVAVVSTL
ncbi:class A beta-lactamase-related serine hydrolase [Abyssalbus ytuae]|uniref:beta-lactamase n=1 Tax=Abyssalbus ytuae TaxID=2926907 RepID=A0A9E6ZJZ4_9FLAO|nr:class A beta-lactamase-related serine hydrolase [Abyssalbus ytuae]UOB17042.1 class A beta-lactamase-related serine hydrolase [Abyssalbus ytuae]